MAQTLPNVNLPKGIPVNLNTETGIVTGTGMIIQNLDESLVQVIEQTTGNPDFSKGFNPLYPSRQGNPWLEIKTPSGDIWVMAEAGGTVNVQEI